MDALQRRPDFECLIPDVTELFHHDEIEVASLSADSRRALAKQHKKYYVDPPLQAYDDAALASAAECTNWPYLLFQPAM